MRQLIVDALRISSNGRVSPRPYSRGSCFSPFESTIGIVPERNWGELTNAPSCFWYEFTPFDSLKLTWWNVLYNRERENPVSFQVEISADGSFVYRYDLSRSVISCGCTNISMVSSNEGLAEILDCSSLTGLTSVTFQRLDPDDSPYSDADEDGLLLEEELFQYGTDPYNSDSDYDGLSDYDEIACYGTDPMDPFSFEEDYPDGVAVKTCGVSPFSFPEGSTNSVIEHIFYSGTTNGAFSFPVSTETMAVLRISVSGAGRERIAWKICGS